MWYAIVGGEGRHLLHFNFQKVNFMSNPQLSAEKIIAIDFALTTDITKCIEDSDFLEKVIREYVADLDCDEIRSNLQMIQEIKNAPA